MFVYMQKRKENIKMQTPEIKKYTKKFNIFYFIDASSSDFFTIFNSNLFVLSSKNKQLLN